MNVDVGKVLDLAATLVVVLAGIGAGVVWLRRWLRKQVADPLASVETQVTPNGGTSMHDSVKNIETEMTSNTAALQLLAQRFDDHLRWAHGGGGRDG